jgi:hypothetical protein
MNKQTWLDTLQDSKGKKISRIWFEGYNTQEGVTKRFNPEAYERWLNRKDKKKTPHYTLPIVVHLFQVWRDYGFFDKSVPLRTLLDRKYKIGNSEFPLFPKLKKEDLRYLPKNYALSLLNLEPIYKFCKDRGIEFSEEEKSFLKLTLLSEHIRKEILEEFPDEDIINATLKYYAKNCILKYFYLLREIRENPKKYKKEMAKAEELNKPTTKEGKQMKRWHKQVMKEMYKNFNMSFQQQKREFDTIKIIACNLPATPSNLLFRMDYLGNLEDKRDMILSIDKKVLFALNIYPSLSSKRDNAPAEHNTILTNSWGIKLVI